MNDALDGVLVVDKPEGMTSHDVVAAVRRRLPRGTRVGHTGTLDPFATGVLPIVVGKATRLSRFLTASRKRYVAGVALGTETDSGDHTGARVATAPGALVHALTSERIAEVLETFIGTRSQVPPAHSAKKVAGERAYDLARRGVAMDLPPVDVTAWVVALVSWDPAQGVATVELETSAGYYVRSFARDVGRALGVCGHLVTLRRTASGTFTLDYAHAFGDVVQASPEQLLTWRLPMAAVLPHLPALHLDETQLGLVLRGQPFALTAEQCMPAALPADEGRVRLLDGRGQLVALATPAAVPRGALHADIVLQ